MNKFGFHDRRTVAKLSEVLALRLDIFHTCRDIHVDIPSSDCGNSFYTLSNSVMLRDVTEQRDSTVSSSEKDSRNLRQNIDRYYLRELSLQDSAEMLGIILRAAEALERNGNVVEDVVRSAEMELEHQRLELRESLLTRFDCREGGSGLASSFEEIWEIVEGQHDTVAKATSVMLHSLRRGCFREIRASALAELQEKETELISLFSEKSLAMDELWEMGRNAAHLEVQEKAFAEAVVEAARANPESKTLQCLAVHAISRAMKVCITTSGVEAGGTLKERWRVFVTKAVESCDIASMPSDTKAYIEMILD